MDTGTGVRTGAGVTETCKVDSQGPHGVSIYKFGRGEGTRSRVGDRGNRGPRGSEVGPLVATTGGWTRSVH